MRRGFANFHNYTALLEKCNFFIFQLIQWFFSPHFLNTYVYIFNQNDQRKRCQRTLYCILFEPVFNPDIYSKRST
jgi:hypothetical protein